LSLIGIAQVSPKQVKLNSRWSGWSKFLELKFSRAGSGWEPESVIRLNGDSFYVRFYKIQSGMRSLFLMFNTHYPCGKMMFLIGQRQFCFECESRSFGQLEF